MHAWVSPNPWERWVSPVSPCHPLPPFPELSESLGAREPSALAPAQALSYFPKLGVQPGVLKWSGSRCQPPV